MSDIPGRFLRNLAHATYPPIAYVPFTPADTELPDGPCRGLRLDADDTLDITEIDGTARTAVQFFKGDNPGFVARVRAQAGSANIWLLY